MPATTMPAKIPLQTGSPVDFSLVRGFFRAAGYDDQTVCRVLGLENMSDVGRVRWDEVKADACSAALRWCLEVFLHCVPADAQESRKVCGAEVFDAFKSLGLLRSARNDPAKVLCPVWLYPVDGFLIASDRRDDPDGGTYEPIEDVVFPAIYAGTLWFLRLLPEARNGEALDHCGGTGIGAMHFLRTARTAATADLTERAAFFADFNARLNDVAITSLCGDLYAPVAGRQFDVISAHPPFVPASGQNMVYRDGGDTGEEVTRRIIEGVPAHLRPGGTCVVLCVARDTKEQTFEQRARDWLGADAGGFDVVFGLEKVLTVEGVVESMRKRGAEIDEEKARQLKVRLESLGTRQFVYGALVIRRTAEAAVQDPLRIHMTPEASAADFDHLLAWRRHCWQPGLGEWLANSRPRPAARLELTARHIVREGELTPVEFVFSIENGFRAALRPDAWVVPLIARLVGTKSVAEVFEDAKKTGDLPEGFELKDFADLVRGMIERGFLEVDFPR